MMIDYQFSPYVMGSLAVLPYIAWRYMIPEQKSLSTLDDPSIKSIPTSTGLPQPRQKKEVPISVFKDLYYKLQNLEHFPEVLPAARRLLRSILDENTSLERYKAITKRSILHIKQYDHNKLQQFISDEFQDVSNDWEAYISRRKAGGPREFFPTREDGVRWLKNLAPLNYIDGAWVCRIHKITTPFALRGVTKHAWQTYSEEMGDGDLVKNHVFIYRRLMDSIGANLPPSDSKDFIQDKHGMSDDGVWKASTAQLLVSLFPNDFLPEILGFNLHFEQLTVGTLKCIKELPDFGIDPEYFALHVSIDNCHSGHSAMALATVDQYLNHVRQTNPTGFDEAWKRIQTGYLLSANVESSETISMFEGQVAKMLQKKVTHARQLHCTSRVRIGQRSLSDWFKPTEISNDSMMTAQADWKFEFLDALANAKPWVYRGNSSKSLLMRELAWKGKMFGAFTDNEVEIVRIWIDSLGPATKHSEKAQVELDGDENAHSLRDLAINHPAFPSQQPLGPFEGSTHGFALRPPLEIGNMQIKALLPIWFAHPCILENTVNSPHKMAAPLTSQILQILRAESGYRLETNGVAGMDELLFANSSMDLVALGLSMCRKHGLPEPACIADVLGQPNEGVTDAEKLAYSMLGWAMRPQANINFLLGLARAFLDLEVYVAESEVLLAGKEREALLAIIARKQLCLDACLALLNGDQQKCREFVAGYDSGRTEIEKVLA